MDASRLPTPLSPLPYERATAMTMDASLALLLGQQWRSLMDGRAAECSRTHTRTFPGHYLA